MASFRALKASPLRGFMSSASPGQLSFDGGCEGRGGRPPVAAEGARLPLGLVRRVVSAEGGGVNGVMLS